MRVLSFGEVLWDVFSDSEYLGGAPLNFAAHFKKCGGESWIVTAVGNDNLGKKTIFEIEKLGVNTEYISITEAETGKCLVTLDSKQIPSYKLLNHIAYDFIQKPSIPKNFFDVLYFGTLALRNENNTTVLGQMLQENSFVDIFVDMNIRAPYYSTDVIRFAFENATIIKISDEELPIVMDDPGGKIHSIKKCMHMLSKEFDNLKIIIITRGDKGTIVYDCNKNYYECDAQKVQVASTVGAGDSFSAAFLTKYIESKDITKALEFATKISGYVVSCIEAIPDYKALDFE